MLAGGILHVTQTHDTHVLADVAKLPSDYRVKSAKLPSTIVANIVLSAPITMVSSAKLSVEY